VSSPVDEDGSLVYDGDALSEYRGKVLETDSYIEDLSELDAFDDRGVSFIYSS
jgi:hypothetical protein